MAMANQISESFRAFAVDDVAAVTDPIWTQSLAENLRWRLKRNVLVLPDHSRPVVNVAIHDARNRDMCVQHCMVSRVHPFIEAVHTAFSQHRPLVVTPDCIWLLLAQGFSHHIAENKEALRSRLVRHQGRDALQAVVRSLTPEGFTSAIASFSAQIRDASDPVLHETLLCDFSTTTEEIRVASEVVLMDAYSSYFRYMMRCICGIPRITLTGRVEDWRRIRDRFEVLATYDLEWWAPRVRPILDEFIRTAEGHPCNEFWRAIYKPKHAYGRNTVTGWAADLFPYLGDAPHRRRNNVLQHPREQWAIPVAAGEKSFGREPGADKGAAGFPSGLCSVPVHLQLPNGSPMNVDLVAGFLALEQNLESSAISPVIGWSVAEPAPAEPVWL